MKQPGQSYISIFSFPDLRKRLSLVAIMFVVYAIGIQIPIAGTNPEVLKQVFGGGGILGVLNLFTGGALANFSIFALGVIPYINASIAMQVLTFSIPYLEELQKEQGEEGRRKIGIWTRYLAIALAFFQSFALVKAFGAQLFLQSTTLHTIYTIFSLVGGTCFLMWLGEQITERGVGDGISLIIFASIVIDLPTFVARQITIMHLEHKSPGKLVSFILFLLVMIALIVFVELAVRKIPVKYARRGAVFMPYGGQSSFLPIKVNLGGVIPIIFAITFASLFNPQFPLIGLFRNYPKVYAFFDSFYSSAWYILAFAVLIILFNHFYSAIIFKPDEIADNLKNSGGFIPGVRPGEQTRDYIARIQEKVTWIGGVFLACVGILPLIFGRVMNMEQSLPVSGTGILILVGVGLDLMRQLEAHIVSRHYEGFIR
ncbi:MAG: preprotein translocase subunit SecY [bacterium JZ-2024 1]